MVACIKTIVSINERLSFVHRKTLIYVFQVNWVNELAAPIRLCRCSIKVNDPSRLTTFLTIYY